jgi:hypothetical protein
MSVSVRSAQLFFLSALSFTAACGGGGGTGGVPTAPPSPDFSVVLSATSVTVSQGGTSSPVNVSINAQNGFSAAVQITITGLPAGSASNPASPFSVAAGQSVSVLFGATAAASTGQFNLTAQGTSGSLSHSQNFTLSIQSTGPSNLPRSAYVENDSVATADTPQGQPHRRHVVFDSANQRFYRMFTSCF